MGGKVVGVVVAAVGVAITITGVGRIPIARRKHLSLSLTVPTSRSVTAIVLL